MIRAAVIAVAAVVALGLVGAPAASATAHFYASGTGGFTGQQLGNKTYIFFNTAHTRQFTIVCPSATYDGLKPASGVATTFDFNYHPGTCSVNLGPVISSVTPPWCAGPWRLTLTTAFPAPPATGMLATWRTCVDYTFTIDAAGCTVTYAYTTIANGAHIQDRNAANTADALPGAAGGMQVAWNTALPYTSTCSGVEPSGIGHVDGVGWFPGIWAGA